MNIALLVIDIQKAYLEEVMHTKAFDDTMMYINATSNLFRKNNHPVIVIRDLSEGDDDSYLNVGAFNADPNDIEVIKYHGNSFWQTPLDQILKERHIDFLVLCGNAAEFCVLATYNGALERGYKVVVLQHGVFARRESGLLDLYWNRSLISYTALNYMLKE